MKRRSEDASDQLTKATKHVAVDFPTGVPLTCTRRSRYLDKLNEHKRDKRIYFDFEPHLYYVDWKGDGNFVCQGNKSVTGLCHAFFDEFDADKVIAKMMLGKGWPKHKLRKMTPEAIKKMWADSGKEAREHGTKLHDFIDCWYNKEVTFDDEAKAGPIVTVEINQFREFNDHIKEDLEPYRSEWFIFTDETYRITGAIDMLYVSKSTMDAVWKAVLFGAPQPKVLHLTMVDWKRTKCVKRFNPWGKGVGPCRRMPDSNFFHYSLQLNVYKWILENFYSGAMWQGHCYERIEVDTMFLCVLHPNRPKNARVQLPNMQREVATIMEMRKQSLKNVSEGKPELFPFDRAQPPTFVEPPVFRPKSPEPNWDDLDREETLNHEVEQLPIQ